MQTSEREKQYMNSTKSKQLKLYSYTFKENMSSVFVYEDIYCLCIEFADCEKELLGTRMRKIFHPFIHLNSHIEVNVVT